MADQHMLSTSDNPYNPWTQWDQWFAWDTQEQYHSLSLLGRVVRTSDELSPQMQDEAVEDAIDEIVTENVSGVHIKVAKPDGIQTVE
jgi:hypothetical protein